MKKNTSMTQAFRALSHDEQRKLLDARLTHKTRVEPQVERMTAAPKIRKTELVHGAYYRGQCRNATVARWNGEKQKFIHFRTKFGNVFLEEICCPEDDQVWDVFYAEEVIEPQDVTKAILFGGE